MEQFNICKVCDARIELINEKFNLGQCSKCKFIFCLTAYSQEQFVTVYDELYNKEDSKYQRHSIIEFDQIVKEKVIKIGLNRSRLIKKNILNSNCQSVLEIGSGIGLIGAYVRLKNEQIKYTGIELDEEAFRKSQLLQLNTINGDFTEMEKIEGQFDVIMLWEVIEHLQDLKLFLDLAYKKLNNKGKIILSTPNYNKIRNYPNREKDQLFQDEPPIHLNFFTTESIKNIFELYHFTNCKIEIKKFPYVALTKKLFFKNSFKALLNNYQGSTIYLEATKK
ncbi:class I SAM-dependent methyltransferase [Flavobacterium sp. ZT3R18]|uniref:class I SAM-dependent methyltransferase n=1 Tax=Flavobacterium sp. ZT3R18 TaxID=2594429 RepID=UPI00117A182C|nr:class I SAM-dependent methyltransferase [Flavobacterium sp. ZT3R18]TRX34853.1 class I SAM-dependent methyltransferase [Flavobacterium sp. ZT3R18]